MIYNMYSIRDLKVGFDFPHPDHSDASAIRGFTYQVNSNDMLKANVKDYDLYRVGEFDTESGAFVPLIVPALVISGASVIGDRNENKD